MRYQVIQSGKSRSFPDVHELIAGGEATGDVLLMIGADAGAAFRLVPQPGQYRAILIELGTECLGTYTGEGRGEEGSNLLGFSRFCIGDARPSDLVELVRQPRTAPAAIEAARAVFEEHGLKVALCGDFAGRILDRLIRPYYNTALRRLDEGLATASDMDTTLKLGLGYPEGPIELLERTGLARHFEITQALYEAYGDPAYAPARRARVAKQRQGMN